MIIQTHIEQEQEQSDGSTGFVDYCKSNGNGNCSSTEENENSDDGTSARTRPIHRVLKKYPSSKVFSQVLCKCTYLFCFMCMFCVLTFLTYLFFYL